MHKTNPIRTTNELLNVLGDQEDSSYPIYHDNISHSNGDLSGYTLVSILVNLPTCKMFLYEENPKTHDMNFELDICNHTQYVYRCMYGTDGMHHTCCSEFPCAIKNNVPQQAEETKRNKIV